MSSFPQLYFYRSTIILNNNSDKSRICNFVLNTAFDCQKVGNKENKKQIKWPNKNVVKTKIKHEKQNINKRLKKIKLEIENENHFTQMKPHTRVLNIRRQRHETKQKRYLFIESSSVDKMLQQSVFKKRRTNLRSWSSE